MGDFDHNGIHVNHINYPRVMSKAHQESKNIFNNQKRGAGEESKLNRLEQQY